MSSETLGHCLHQIFGLYVKRFSRESAHRQIPYPRPLTWEGKSTVLQMMSSWTLFVILLITDPLSSLPLVQFETCPTQEFPLHVRYQVSVVWLHRTIALSPLRSTQALRGALGWGHPTTEKDRKTTSIQVLSYTVQCTQYAITSTDPDCRQSLKLIPISFGMKRSFRIPPWQLDLIPKGTKLLSCSALWWS